MKPVTILEKLYTYSLYALVFLIPVWFLPFTQDMITFQKQALLILLVMVAGISWLAKSVLEGEFTLRLTWLHLVMLILLVVSGISTATSLWRYGSFWGFPLNITDSLVTLTMFLLATFLISQSALDEKKSVKMVILFSVSFLIAGIYTVLQLYHIYLLPFAFAKLPTFNTMGSVTIIAMIAAILLPCLVMIAQALEKKKVLFVLAGLLLLLLILINSFNAWVVLMAGLVVVLTFTLWNAKKISSLSSVYFSVVLLVVSLGFLIFRFAIPGFPVAPIEISPSRIAEFTIAKNVLSHDPILGTGPGTFVYNYAQYHESSLNKTVFWGTRFISGASEIFDWFITKGFLGGLAFVALLAMSVICLIKSLLKNSENETAWFLRLGILSAMIGVITAYLIYYSNFTLSFLVWILLGILISLTATSEKKITLKPHSFLSIGVSFVSLLLLVLSLGFMLLAGQKYVSEVLYLKGAQMVSVGKTNEGMLKILSAANLSPSIDLYYRDLAQLSVSQLTAIQLDKNLSSDKKKEQMQITINGAANFANRAIAVNPANIENWNVRGFVFRNLIGVPGADAVATESYNKAHQLEPASPFSLTELGRVYLAQAQNVASDADKKNEALNNALDNLNKAIELKSDYAPAHYLIALTYGQQGKTDDGIARLEKTKEIAPKDIGLAFQLGVLYYQRNQLTKAQGEFERAKDLEPNYSNARYMLGLVYDKLGQKSKAIDEFTSILNNNPDNAQVQKILGNLNAGKSALAGIVDSEPTDSDTPAEIKKKK